ncbi:hypothetical protein ACWT_1904 [Actinoplanes sp. SE50]|uniref:excalibur calcium-binding domain-containing protein n=1 Tax=unclassified Actinoplanes TaxID=2626549 RepID=UPI00023EBEAD|nr:MULTISPECIES: excalibur calcium-binding domain-containing protein [unclassified Actinoplanes]AEV82923.1 yhjA-like uncharacterized protein [Actinoplanes sp. SE50/110]ATO81319.1 hypothetical protein ACWT_1904 [Actinoplanes sp. SE50]SLL98726.1 hypothetical protein ACSP50_1953 [Actinoplanes sp. SE50/110]
MRTVIRGIVVLALVAGGGAGMVGPAGAAPAVTFKNCTELNKKYKHGVGKRGAEDRVSGSTKPVTTFSVNNDLYAANKRLDRDKDGIACEKR